MVAHKHKYMFGIERLGKYAYNQMSSIIRQISVNCCGTQQTCFMPWEKGQNWQQQLGCHLACLAFSRSHLILLLWLAFSVLIMLLEALHLFLFVRKMKWAMTQIRSQNGQPICIGQIKVRNCMSQYGGYVSLIWIKWGTFSQGCEKVNIEHST